ncbi:lipase family protein [Nocardia abscessus]|uniref:lipase family protein n=1 Tax=Nocardia abscessus TaxID=120957 RepID=UPI00189499D8|nr:lipase family protein [Nocardia abscessus]MBF6476100.1 lipase [Nocardia abscessus]
MKSILPRPRKPLGQRLTTAAVTAVLMAGPLVGAGIARSEEPGVAGLAGDVVRVEPSTFDLFPGVPAPVDAWKIHYRSTDALGQPNVVSGRILIPRDGRAAPRPLVTYAVGTVGIGDQCAPSATGGPREIGGILEKGWAVVVTDYQGLGTPGDHTYLVGRAEGTAVLDAARAAERLPEANARGVTAASPVGIVGYSQGGHASSWAAELSDEYAPELQIKAVVAGGVPADTLTDALQQRGKLANPAAYFMVAIGHDAAYPELQLDSYLTDEGRSFAQKIRTGCVLDNLIAGQGKTLDRMLTRNPIDTPEWQARLAEDRLGTRAPGYPIYLFHGVNDDIVSFEFGVRVRSDWCRLGNVVEWHALPAADHITAAALGGNAALDWLGRRLAGQPAQGNCAS